MISQRDEYKQLIEHRLKENIKSFELLFGLKHYGNCISILCQELDQIVRLLFLLNSRAEDRRLFMESSINSHKWFRMNSENKKELITEEILLKFTDTLNGWDRAVYEFGFAFNNLSSNFNYGSKDPIKSMSDVDRQNLYKYITEYHVKDFPREFTLGDLVPILPAIIKLISKNLLAYLEMLE